MPSDPNETPFDTGEPPNLLRALMMRRLPSTQEKPSTTPTLSPVEVAPLLFSVIAAALLLAPAGSNLDRPQTISVMASVLAIAVFVPQAVRVWRAHNDHHALRGVSVTTNVFIINNSIV